MIRKIISCAMLMSFLFSTALVCTSCKSEEEKALDKALEDLQKAMDKADRDLEKATKDFDRELEKAQRDLDRQLNSLSY